MTDTTAPAEAAPARTMTPAQVALAVERRRAARREEFDMQERLARLLDRYLDRANTFWCSLENKPLSIMSGLFGKRRGIVSGMPDVLVIQARRGGLVRVVCIELKAKAGIASASQKEIRNRMMPVGIAWWLARTPAAALAALRRSGIAFKHAWQEPDLPAWAGPFADPSQPLPMHPQVRAERRAAHRRWKADKREREAAMLAARSGTGTPAKNEARRGRLRVVAGTDAAQAPE